MLYHATATAYLSELHAAARPGRPRTRAEMVATAANLGGLGFGPLLAGFLAQYAADPLQVPHLVAEALMLVGAAGLALAPETVPRTGERPAYRRQQVSVPPACRTLFSAAGATAAAEFALFGVFTSLAPEVIAGLVHVRSHALAGAAAFAACAAFAAAALAQIALSRAPVRRQLGLGLAGLITGLAVVTLAIWHPSLWRLLRGAAALAGRPDRGQAEHGAPALPPTRPHRGNGRNLHYTEKSDDPAMMR